jgi:hypothetical protein
LPEPVEIRTERTIREVLFPQPRREEKDVKGRMGVDPLEHVQEVNIEIAPSHHPVRSQNTNFS